MKKLLTALVGLAMFAMTASADLARVEMGVGMWNQTPDGFMSYTENGIAGGTYTSDKKEDSTAYVWMLIQHPIPILPNIRIEYTNVKDTGIVDGDFKDFTLPVGITSTPSSIEMVQYDIIPYYNMLDNTFWTSIDIGLDLKISDTTYSVDGVNVEGIDGISNYEDTTMVVIPLVYVRVRVEIPVTNIGLEADVKYISYEDSTISDIRVKVDYTFEFIPVI